MKQSVNQYALFPLFWTTKWSVISEKYGDLLPPASEGWGKVIFSVCTHAGVPHSEGGGIPSFQAWMGVPSHWNWMGVPLISIGMGAGCGYPLSGLDGRQSKRAAQWVLATWRAVCLLRSRRRTLLFLRMFTHFSCYCTSITNSCLLLVSYDFAFQWKLKTEKLLFTYDHNLRFGKVISVRQPIL